MVKKWECGKVGEKGKWEDRKLEILELNK